MRRGLLLILLLAGCAAPLPEAVGVREPGPETVRPMPRPDVTAEVSTEVAAPVAPGVLGRTVASLGNPGEPGLWLATPLVSAVGPGWVRVGAGPAVAVELRPSGGAAGSGSRLSLTAFQALGVPLTSLPELEVLAGG